MNRRVLFVDDEPKVLQAVQRALRKDFEVSICEYPEQALASLADLDEPFAAIVSDMRMPKMTGVEFLQMARKVAPDSVRMMLTGNTDLETAMAAVNTGEVFRFITKPCESSQLASAVETAIKQHELLRAERDLLEKTVRGSVALLIETLALSQPEIFGRVSRLRQLARQVAGKVDGIEDWELDTAISLSQLGCLSLRAELVRKAERGDKLSEAERAEWMSHPEIGAKLVGEIERLGGIATIIRYQDKWYNGKGLPQDSICGESIPLISRLLHAVLAFDGMFIRGHRVAEILDTLKAQKGRFDPAVIAALAAVSRNIEHVATFRVSVAELRSNMRIAEDVRSNDGALLVSCGQEVTAAVTRHLSKFVLLGSIQDSILVSIEHDVSEHDASESDVSGSDVSENEAAA